MRVIGFSAPGGPEVLRSFEIDERPVRDREVKIRVHAATVNPSDLVSRSGALHDRYASVKPPYVPGWDAAGIVVEVGDGVDWRVGDEVVAITLPVLDGGGAYADRIVVSAESVAAKPTELTFAEAATFPMNGLTALRALDDAGVGRGSTIAVTGAAGAVGGLVVELAARRGVTVIVDAADKDAELLRGFGAEHVVPRSADFAAQVRRIVPGGVDAVIDTALLRGAALAAVRDRGTFVGLRTPQAGGGVDDERGIDVKYPIVAKDIGASDRLREIMSLAASGALTARVADVVSAELAAEAHRTLEAGGVRGRLVLDFS